MTTLSEALEAHYADQTPVEPEPPEYVADPWIPGAMCRAALAGTDPRLRGHQSFVNAFTPKDPT
jgi:hypothetical protein